MRRTGELALRAHIAVVDHRGMGLDPQRPAAAGADDDAAELVGSTVRCRLGPPTLNPAAHELRVSVPELRWEYHEMDESGQPVRRLWGEEEPPWAFVLQLPPSTE